MPVNAGRPTRSARPRSSCGRTSRSGRRVASQHETADASHARARLGSSAHCLGSHNRWSSKLPACTARFPTGRRRCSSWCARSAVSHARRVVSGSPAPLGERVPVHLFTLASPTTLGRRWPPDRQDCPAHRQALHSVGRRGRGPLPVAALGLGLQHARQAGGGAGHQVRSRDPAPQPLPAGSPDAMTRAATRRAGTRT